MEVAAELRGEGAVGLVYRLIDHSFNRSPMRVSLWTKHRSSVTLLRLPGAERPIGG